MSWLTHGEAHLRAWLQLNFTPHVGVVTLRKLLAQFGLPETVLAQTHHSIKLVVGERAADAIKRPSAELSQMVDNSLAWANAPDCFVIAWGHAEYPTQLLTIDAPPPVLYVHGQLAALQQPSIGVVGSRNATAQGIENAKAFAQALAGRGLTVNSGLALGIDTAAHEGALDSSNALATVAVVGTGIDRVYPAKNKDLAHRIVARGAIVSEFALGAPPVPAHFPARNHTLSGLSRGVLVVEAAAKSGSLITARLAGEQGREIFAIPGSIHSPLSKGCHQLIKQGAKLVDSAQDILEELQMHAVSTDGIKQLGKKMQNAPSPSHSSLQQQVLDAIGFEPTSVEQVVSRTQLTAGEVLTALTELELFGQVNLLEGARYQKAS